MMLEVRHLCKTFGRRIRALDDVSFRVRRGEIYGLLGHNGAGKSTALGAMLGMVYPDSGEVMVDGVSVQRQREKALTKVGAIFETPAFYNYLSGWQNLRLLTVFSGYWNGPEVEEIVGLVGLTDRIGSKVGTYSHGMRQRLALAQALLPRPELLLLDEPTDGLDPEGIKEFRELIRRLRDERGLTVLLNSHLLSEVELLCDRVAILKRGRLVYEGSGKDSPGAAERVYRLEIEPEEGWQKLAHKQGFRVLPEAEGVEVPPGKEIASFVSLLVGEGFLIRQVVRRSETLEDLYLSVGEEGGEGAGLSPDRKGP